ncbi:MAG: CRTAC1 family protein [Candidatus Marinimicrobia bacterium]|nr:CRTAC1 family protein [Candidatus Neomarinimicrobiota bacterium]
MKKLHYILFSFCLLFTVISCDSDENAGREGAESDYPISFADATESAGLDAFYHETGAFGEKWMPETFGSGCGFIDYNNDGWQDIILLGGGSWPEYSDIDAKTIWLYENNQDGTFTDVTEAAGLSDIQTYTFGLTAADYDNDGDQDLYLTTLYENLLFRNDEGFFTEIGAEAGVAGASTWSTATMFVDADRDGHLDLYAGNYVNWTPENDIFCSLDGTTKAYCTPALYDGVAGRFFHNNGDGTFTDITEDAGFLPSPGKTLGVAETDFNRDGWSDIVVANDTERNLLYVNDGDGTFTERGMLAGVAFDEIGKARAGMGIDIGVVDSTGEVSVFVGNFSNEMIGVFRHSGNGLFMDRAAVSKIGRPSLLILTFGAFLFDVDYDTDLDLYAANGHIQKLIQDGSTYRQPSQLYMNNGDGVFQEVSDQIGRPLKNPLVSRGTAYADYDRDGDIDVLITENGGPAHLFENRSERGNFLRIQVRGTQSNADGIGTRINAYIGDFMMERRIRTGGSYLANNEKEVVFGTGNVTTLDSLVLTWPSGEVDTFTDIQVNRQLLFTEGESNFREINLPGLENPGSADE